MSISQWLKSSPNMSSSRDFLETYNRKKISLSSSRKERLREVYGHILFGNELKCHLNRVQQQKQQLYRLIIFYFTVCRLPMLCYVLDGGKRFYAAARTITFPVSTSSLHVFIEGEGIFGDHSSFVQLSLLPSAALIAELGWKRNNKTRSHHRLVFCVWLPELVCAWNSSQTDQSS